MISLKADLISAKAETLGSDIFIGAFSCIICEHGEVSIGERTRIGHHTLIRGPSVVGPDVIFDDYCEMRRDSKVGAHTQILYGAKIFEQVEIGERCIIGSSVANWTKIGSNVTFMGSIVHTYNRGGKLEDWNGGPVPSPVVEDNCVIGESAMLVGGITIGHGSYVGLGEIVKCSIPANSAFVGGRIRPLSDFRGFIKSRED